MRKKFILWAIAALIGLALFFSAGLDTLISLGVEDVVGSMTGVPVHCGPTDFSLARGRGTIFELAIANPTGFSTDEAILIGRSTFSVDQSTILSSPVVIPELVLENPLIRFEPGVAFGKANVDELMAHVRASAAKAQAGHPTHDIRLRVGQLTVRGAKVRVVLEGLAEPVPDIPVPEITLTGLGDAPDGISAEEIFDIVFKAVHGEVMRKIEEYIPGLAIPANRDATAKEPQ